MCRNWRTPCFFTCAWCAKLRRHSSVLPFSCGPIARLPHTLTLSHTPLRKRAFQNHDFNNVVSSLQELTQITGVLFLSLWKEIKLGMKRDGMWRGRNTKRCLKSFNLLFSCTTLYDNVRKSFLCLWFVCTVYTFVGNVGCWNVSGFFVVEFGSE